MALILTTAVIGQSDVNRLLRELNSLNDFFVSASARKAGQSLVPPKTTQDLDELAKTNKLNLLTEKDRAKLVKQLNDSLAAAPKLKISFAVEPPPKVVAPILAWLRQNLDPGILLQIGLQPNIGAGCVLRTANREFDMSMRQHMIDSRPYLAELIEGAAKKHQVSAAPAPAPQSAAPPPATPNPPAARSTNG